METGFISNPTEEQLLFQRSHQDKLARALAKAITQYFEEPPEGTLFANRNKTQKYKVQRAIHSLLLPTNTATSIEAIKRTNKLTSNSLSVGQVITIQVAFQARFLFLS